MNTPIEIASAELFVEMIQIIFFSGKKSSTIILPDFGLNEALVHPAARFILNKGGEISLSERVDKIETVGKRITKVSTSKREIDNFDLVISTIPADNLVKIIPEEFKIRMNIPSFEYSPIISVNLWYNKNPLKEKFYGIIDGEFHWLFNKGDYITLIKSAANNIVNLKKNEIIETAISEMNKYFPILNNIEIIDSKIIKERKATIISSSNSVEQRKKLNHNFSNLFIAGDWVNTGLPSTIESSIKSGKKISELILSQTNKY
jgi:protoporphyrinogen oxidase